MQRKAAETVNGPLLILAGAGSGKTRTVTYRIANLVKNLKVNPSNILAVSFTNKAAKEMKERVMTLLGKKLTKGMTLSTFHSLGVRILKQQITTLGYQKNFSIYDTSDQLSIIKDALKSYKAQKNFDSKIIQSRISLLKNNGLTPDEYINSHYCDPDLPYDQATEYVYSYYQDKLRFYNAIDFDDILFLTVKILKENPEIASEYSEKFRYIMIDEYQDTNSLQFDLIAALTKEHNNLCVVGDDDQSIYAFRGADVTNILNFEKQYPGAQVIKLEQNYRSNDKILNLANVVIKENKKRKEKKLWSEKIEPHLPQLWCTGNTDHEAKIVVEDIVRRQSAGEFLGEMAILYRSNTQTLPFEDELRLSQVPYKIFGGQKFYDKKEIKDLIAYLTAVHNPRNELAMRRILNLPARGIGLKTLQKFLEISKDEHITLYKAFEENKPGHKGITNFIELMQKTKENFDNNSLSTAVEMLIDDINFKDYIGKHYEHAKQINSKIKDLDYFVESARRFEEYQKAHGTLQNFVERLLLSDAQDKKKDEKDDEDGEENVHSNSVSLMTLHSSKGLEYDLVYLIGMEEEILPHKKTIKEGGDLEEERRLCYVGITRARENLIMTYSSEREQYGKTVKKFASRFIREFEEFYETTDKNSFDHLSQDEFQEYKKDYFADLFQQLKKD